MNAITIIQPFAHLITLPESHPQHKRCENRTWYPKGLGAFIDQRWRSMPESAASTTARRSRSSLRRPGSRWRISVSAASWRLRT